MSLHTTAGKAAQPNIRLPCQPGPTLTAMRQILLRAVARLVAWAIGLLLAAGVVPGVWVSTSGFVVAVLIFTLVQTALSPFILRLPHGWASLVMGTAGLVMTNVALGVAVAATHGLGIGGMAAWVATAALAWLTTTIAAILLPDVYAGAQVASA